MNLASGKTIQFWKKGRVLRGGYLAKGHHYVTLVGADGVHTTVGAHRLVLLAHVGAPPPGKPFGLHRDDVPSNNWVDNLYWGDRPANSYDSIRNGTHVQARKTTCKLGHALVDPNLVLSTSKHGFRSCLACKLALACHNHDAKLRAQGKARTRYNRSKNGFQRRVGESFEQEADRRYAHIMAGQMP